MAFSTGAQAQLAYIPEVTWGTTPATPQMLLLPVSTAKMWRTVGERDAKLIRADRQVPNYFGGARLGNLELEFPHTVGVYADLYKLAFFDATGPVFTIGTTPLFSTFELGHLDIGQYETLVGAMCKSITWSCQGYDFFRVKMALIGLQYALNSASLDDTPTPASTTAPRTTNGMVFNWWDAINYGGTQRTLKLSGFEITLDNNLDTIQLVNTRQVSGVVPGRAKVTGSFNVPFEDNFLMDAFNNETKCSFGLIFGSGNLKCASLKFTSSETPVDKEGALFTKLNWQATDLTLTDV
ncbi:MAG: phage tail tube protein [Gammaproteobacteria bacterium]|nr:phage tail tube protein [Gammaproteobacteria bacterium]